MLSRLTVRGFKSFADPISLELGPGVNVVVDGQNGAKALACLQKAFADARQ